MKIYVLSTFNLNRELYIQPLLKLILLFNALFNYIIKVIKPLHNISKAGNN